MFNVAVFAAGWELCTRRCGIVTDPADCRDQHPSLLHYTADVQGSAR